MSWPVRRTRWPSAARVPNDQRAVSSIPDDHHRPAQVVKYGLRNTSQEKAADCPESSSSENDEVDIAAARAPHDFPRRIALRHQSLDWTSSFPEYRGRVRQNLVRVRPLFLSIIVELLIGQ